MGHSLDTPSGLQQRWRTFRGHSSGPKWGVVKPGGLLSVDVDVPISIENVRLYLGALHLKGGQAELGR